MPSLRQLERHGPLLVIDAASSVVQVGLVGVNGPGRWATNADEAGVAVFGCIEKLGVDVNSIAGFAFCDGPGSVLGIRTVAMALRAWRVLKSRPVFAYSSLALVAHALGRAGVGVIADARRDAWHHYEIGRGLRRVPAADLNGSAELVMPENFRHWSALPANVGRVPYSVADLLPKVIDADLFLETDTPDAFLHEEPSYVTWTPQIHRAPGERP
jgi:tRNA threonylcarbamoyladenosine biosynthesis protein TsaB